MVVRKIGFIFFILVLVLSCTAPQTSNTPKRVLMIIAQNNFQDQEYLVPRQVLEDNNIQVEVASIEKIPAAGTGGTRVVPDLAVKDAQAEDYDAIVVVGGAGSPELAQHEEVLALLRAAAEKDKIVAAICFGPISLARAGVLEGKTATVYAQGTDLGTVALQQGGATYVNQPVVTDGNIVTANGPNAAENFGKKIVSLLT